MICFKVMLVDDDKIILFLHKHLIDVSSLPKEPLTFSNGKEAFSFLKNEALHQEKYLVLLDLNMPQMNGWEFLDKIQQESIKEQVGICIVTSSINSDDRVKALEYPQVIDYVEKPLNERKCDELSEKVRTFFKTEK